MMKLNIVFESEKIRDAYLTGDKKLAWGNGNSCLDLRSAEEAFVLQPGEKKLVSSGVRAQIVSDNDGWEIQLRPRSGMGSRGILMHFGTIDHSYIGVMGIVLFNASKDPLKVEFGDRIAQIAICPIAKPEIHFVDELMETTRGDKGFGASGVK
jgi:dUTP pyrophosphatase